MAQDYLDTIDPLEEAQFLGARSSFGRAPAVKAPKAAKVKTDPLDNPDYKVAHQARQELFQNESYAKQRLRDFNDNEGSSLKDLQSRITSGIAANQPGAELNTGTNVVGSDPMRGVTQNTKQLQLLMEKRQRLSDEADRITKSRVAFDQQHFMPLRNSLMGTGNDEPASDYTGGAGTLTGGNNPNWHPAPQDYLAPVSDDWVGERVAGINAKRQNSGEKPIAPGSVSAGNFTEDWAPLQERANRLAQETGSEEPNPNDDNQPGSETAYGGRDSEIPDVLAPESRNAQHQAMTDDLKSRYARSSPLERLGMIFGSKGYGSTPIESRPSIGSEAAGTEGLAFTIPKMQGDSALAGAINGANKFTSATITPENALIGAATGGLGELGAVGNALKTAATAGFTYQMGKDIPDSVREAYKVYTDPKSTDAEKAEAIVTPGLQSLMTGLAGKHALTEGASLLKGTPKPHVFGGATPGIGDSLKQTLAATGKYTPEQLAGMSDLDAHDAIQAEMRAAGSKDTRAAPIVPEDLQQKIEQTVNPANPRVQAGGNNYEKRGGSWFKNYSQEPITDPTTTKLLEAKNIATPSPEPQTVTTDVTPDVGNASEAPVDIGERNPEISNGTGVPTSHEAAMLEQWQKNIAEEQANAPKIESAAEVDVRQPPENGGTLGEGNALNQETAREGETPNQGLPPREDVISSETNNQNTGNANEHPRERGNESDQQPPDPTSGLQQIGGEDPSGREQPPGNDLRGQLVQPDSDRSSSEPRLNQGDESSLPGANGPSAGEPNDGLGRNPGELNPNTGIKNASVDEQRKERGLDPEPSRQGETSQEQRDEASARIKADPKAGEKLVNELTDNPRQIDGPESLIITNHLTELRNAHKVASADLDKALDSGDQAAIDKAKGERDASQEAFERASDVAYKTGTKWSDVGRARQQMLKEDYSPANLERQWKQDRQAAGKDFTPEELEKNRTTWKEQSAELERRVNEAEAARTEAEEESANAKAEIAIRDIERTMQKDVKRGPPDKGRIRQWVSDRAAEAYERQKQNLGKTYSNPLDKFSPENLRDYAYITADLVAKGLDAGVELVKRFGKDIEQHIPRIQELAKKVEEQANHVISSGRDTPRERTSTVEAVKERLGAGDKLGDLSSHVRKIAEQHIREGAKGREEVLNKTHETLKEANPEITKREVQDAISGYGKMKPLNPRETLAKLRDVAGQLQQVSKLEDMQKGKAPLKTGIERRIPSEEEKRLIKHVEEAKKKGGYSVSDPAKQLKSSADAISTSLDTQIKELQRQITMEEVFTPGKKEPLSTPEIASKRAKVEQLKAERENIRDKLQPGTEPPTAHETQLASLDTQIKELERQINNREVFTKSQKQIGDSPEAVARLQQIEALKERRENIRKEIQPGKEPLTPEEKDAKKIAASVKAADKTISELKAQINSGAYKLRTKAPDAPTSLQLDAKRAEIDSLTAHRDALRKMAEPAKTPEEIAARDLAAYKARLAQRYSENKATLARHAAGDFSTPPKTAKQIQLDRAATTAAEEVERQKQEIQNNISKAAKQNRTPLEKGIDTIPKISRLNVLSYPSIAIKLAAAAAVRMAHQVVREGVISGLRQIPGVKGVAEQAPRFGSGLQLEAEVKAHTDGLMRAIRASGRYLKNQESSENVLYGDKRPDPEWTNYLGKLHGALKTPAQMTEFERSYYKRTLFDKQRGLNPEDPDVKMQNGIAALKDANRSIFMQDNYLAGMYRSALDRARRVNKEGKVPLVGRATASALETAIPIVKVPLNIAGEVLENLHGPYTAVGRIIANKIKGGDIPPEAADSIMRQLSNGVIGNALLIAGWYGYKNIGAFHQPGEKSRKNVLPADTAKIGSQEIPRGLLHNPQFTTMEVAATAHHLMDGLAHHKKDEPSLPWEAVKSLIGLVDETPIASETLEAGKILETPKSAIPKFIADRAIPGGLQQTAKYFDKDSRGNPIKRDPKTIPDYLKAGIPGLRLQVPKSKLQPVH